MAQEVNINDPKQKWRLELEELSPIVEREKARNEGMELPEACVADSCPEKYVELASRLVALQMKNGELRREDISSVDVNKIKDFSKSRKVSFVDAVSLLVENAVYFNNDVVKARIILNLLEEFDDVYQQIEGRSSQLPLNLLDGDKRRWLTKQNNGLSNAEKMQGIIEVFRPDIEGLEIVESVKSNDLVFRSIKGLSNEEIESISQELSRFANEDGNIDLFFSDQNETNFYALCSKLKASGYTFDEFVKGHTQFHYTPCFRGNLLSTVKAMVQDYQRRHGTTQGMVDNDPYLRNKVEAAQNAAGVHSTRFLLLFMGVSNDCPDYTAKVLGPEELRQRESDFLKQMKDLYADGQINDSFSSKHEELYDEMSMLASRLRFKSVDDYLSARGFKRTNTHNRLIGRVVYLSEFDIGYYRLFEGLTTEEEFDKRCKELELVQIDPAQNFGIYRKLACEHKDVRQTLAKRQKNIFVSNEPEKT